MTFSENNTGTKSKMLLQELYTIMNKKLYAQPVKTFKIERIERFYIESYIH